MAGVAGGGNSSGGGSGAEPAGQAANRSPEGVAADLIRRSSRDVKEKGDPADATLLRDAIAELRRCWAGSSRVATGASPLTLAACPA